MDDQEHDSRGSAPQVLQQGKQGYFSSDRCRSVCFLMDIEWREIYERKRLTFPSRFQKKGDQPTGQQRRKHQITYLIHQAKERELELKNNWADNKMTRRQTQAKYGF